MWDSAPGKKSIFPSIRLFLVSCMHYREAGIHHLACAGIHPIPDVLLNQNWLQRILQFQNSFPLDRELHSLLCISPDRPICIPHSCTSSAADNGFPLEEVILSGVSGQAPDNNTAAQACISGSQSQLSSPPGDDSPLKWLKTPGSSEVSLSNLIK